MEISSLPEQRPILEEISIDYYENEVPEFVAAELSRLYGNIFSSLHHLQAGGAVENSNTYVVRKGHERVTVFLLRQEKHRMQVINEGMKIDEAMVNCLAKYIFSRFSSVISISFHAVENVVRRLPFPCHHYNLIEDIVLAMPRTAEEYYARLGKSTQRYLLRYLNKTKREFPSFSFEVYSGKDVREQHIRAILQLYKSRMASKKKVMDHSEERIRKTLRRIQFGGFIGLIKIDGLICAGTINYSEGKNFFLEVLAHDPNFNDYRFGTICCYLTICECIAQGGNEYHFLWGEYEYKYRLQGIKRNLDHLVVYRSRAHVLLDLPTIFKNAGRDYARRLTLWLRAIEREDGIGSWLVGHARSFVRRMR